ncbi:M15 family metallopeptidase [Nocardia seriolae]|nr:peptidase M15 [Nocardia seriolae]MTJ70208.1 peptidase M15 [Nocardia seriolae]MTJ88807.1 peptidase M15 [Nocardia seriolae]MTK32788.1 peptidase M15 [Nocardia seriolae]MTK41290.1 peptidase M15 [Nocardia seriolae]
MIRRRGVRRVAAMAVLLGGSLAAVPAVHAVPVLPQDLSINGEGIPTAQAIAAGTDGLDPLLAAAYTSAAAQAHANGVALWITSGYRTPAEQEALWEDGIQTYGTPEAARRWVLPPGESTHVTGEAIDVGPREGAQWLEDNGNHWGLCRMYDNEWWHFELATAPDGPCPARLPDASLR